MAISSANSVLNSLRETCFFVLGGIGISKQPRTIPEIRQSGTGDQGEGKYRGDLTARFEQL
jgi:hypothetical protein